jgi:YD repeat-containing protein
LREVTVNYQYDAGRLTSRTDNRGITTNYAYDAIGRVTGISYSDGTPPVSYAYDQYGDIGLTSESDATGTSGARQIACW